MVQYEWRVCRKVEFPGAESHWKSEKREGGERKRGFRVMRFMMCRAFRDGRICLREACRDFAGAFWMA